MFSTFIFRIQFVTIILSVAILILKFWAYYLTGSKAIFTDALESIVNVVAGFFALFSLYLANLPKDENHPYGHGKIEFISAGIEGSLITAAGCYMVIEVILTLYHREPIQALDKGLIIIVLAGAINWQLGRFLIRLGQQHRSPTLLANGTHLQADAYANIALLGGLLLVFLTGYTILDSAITLVFSAVLMVTGIGIVRKAMAGILDEMDYYLAAEVIKCLQNNRKTHWIDCHNFRIIQYGAALHIDCHITVPYFFTVEQAHDIVKDIEDTLGANTDRNLDVFIHTDPCIPAISCAICAKADCQAREYPFKKQIFWDLETVLKNQKHS